MKIYMLNMKVNIMNLDWLLVDFCFAESTSKSLTRGHHCLFSVEEMTPKVSVKRGVQMFRKSKPNPENSPKI